MGLTPFLLLENRAPCGGMLSKRVEDRSQISTDHKLNGLIIESFFSSNEILHLFLSFFLGVECKYPFLVKTEGNER